MSLKMQVATVAANTRPTAAQTQSQLLGLPPEIRNMIRVFAVTDSTDSLEGGRISITPMLRLPGLLAACRQIRQEALKLYFTHNHFRIDIYGFDATLLRQWVRIGTNTAGMDVKRPVYRICRSKHFTNLTEWCRMRHTGHIPFIPQLAPKHLYHSIAHQALAIAEACQDKPWATCEALLEDFRLTLNLAKARGGGWE